MDGAWTAQVRRERVGKPASKAARARAAEAVRLAAAQGLTVRQALAREALIHSEAQAAATRSTSTMRAWLRHKGVGQPESHTKRNPPGKQQRYATVSRQRTLSTVIARSKVLCRIPVTMHRVLLSDPANARAHGRRHATALVNKTLATGLGYNPTSGVEWYMADMDANDDDDGHHSGYVHRTAV